MDFIATYWWVWLVGVLAILGLVVVRSIANSIGLAKDAVTIVGKLRLAMQVPAEQRRQQFTNLGLEVASDKIKNRAMNYVVTGVLALIGGGFGILLVLAIIQHVIVYSRTAT